MRLLHSTNIPSKRNWLRGIKLSLNFLVLMRWKFELITKDCRREFGPENSMPIDFFSAGLVHDSWIIIKICLNVQRLETERGSLIIIYFRLEHEREQKRIFLKTGEWWNKSQACKKKKQKYKNFSKNFACFQERKRSSGEKRNRECWCI